MKEFYIKVYLTKENKDIVRNKALKNNMSMSSFLGFVGINYGNGKIEIIKRLKPIPKVSKVMFDDKRSAFREVIAELEEVLEKKRIEIEVNGL